MSAMPAPPPITNQLAAANRPQRILIACGGTGGHLFPGIAVAQAAQRRGHTCLLIISEKEIDALASKAHPDIQFAKIPAIAMPKLLSLEMPRFLWRLWRTIRQCRKLIQEFQATTVLGMGGFTSLPPLYAGKKLGLPTFLHESNAIPGKANRMAAKFCRTVLLGMADCARHFPAGKTALVGTPLRESLLATAPTREHAAQAFQLDPRRQTVLVMGGSQGARGVNDSVVRALELLGENAPQVLHLTGPKELECMQQAYARLPHVKAHVAPFCSQMEQAYALADACVCRSGASSLTELSAFGIPTLLIPYPYAADDHQTRNAQVFVQAHAALMAVEKDLTPESMADYLRKLTTDAPLRDQLHQAMRSQRPEEAAEQVVAAIGG